MHKEGFPEDQRGHYPGAIRLLAELGHACCVLSCSHLCHVFVFVCVFVRVSVFVCVQGGQVLLPLLRVF